MSSDGQNKGAAPVPQDVGLLTRLTEYTDDALWLFTPDWETLVYVNSAYEEIFGQPIDSLKDDPTSFLEAVYPEHQEAVTEGMEVLATGEQVDLEFRVDPETDYGTWVWVQGQPIFDDDGDLEYIAGYTRDITERKGYQQQLEQRRKDLERSNESLREFAYIASHDLQEPLRMVSSYVDLLEKEYGDDLDDEAEEYMEYAVNGAKRMKRMINSLLDYSRVHTEAGQPERIEANTVLEDSRQDLEMLLEERDAELTVADLPTVRADPDQLRQVFQNLVKNAIEHASEQQTPKIEVAGEYDEAEGSVVFTVSDNGPGIPESEQESVFKIFHKGADTSSADNTGIGLAITRRIVHRHGGEIHVDSPDGEGATFTFTIPTAVGAEGEEAEVQ